MLKTHAKPEPWNVNPAFLSRQGRALWDGLVILVPCWEGGGNPIDYLTKTSITPMGTQGWTSGHRGTSLHMTDAATSEGGYAFDVTQLVAYLPTTAATIVIHKRKTDATNRASSGFGITSASGVANYMGAHLPYSDGTVYWDFGGQTNNTSRETYAGGTFGDDVWAFTAGYRGMEIWQNGQLRASQTGHATRSNSNIDGFRIGNGNYTVSELNADLCEIAFFAVWDRQLNMEDCKALTLDPWMMIRYAPTILKAPTPAPSAAITGTAGDGATEAEIVAGGETIIITLSNDTWVASGATFDAIRQDIIDGLDSAGAEGTGWNAEVRDKQGVSGVVRTSDTVVTITLDAQAAYNITATETITVTVPGSAVTGANPIVATPTFNVTAITKALPPNMHRGNYRTVARWR